jgi:hypothetical protein
VVSRREKRASGGRKSRVAMGATDEDGGREGRSTGTRIGGCVIGVRLSSGTWMDIYI